jgi:hypothetical protein
MKLLLIVRDIYRHEYIHGFGKYIASQAILWYLLALGRRSCRAYINNIQFQLRKKYWLIHQLLFQDI